VADSGSDSDTLSEGTHEPRECMACRGTGRVISNLGGSPSTVSCPWCGGSGMRPAEVDAQAHWPREQPAEQAEQAEETSPQKPDAAA
jgi:hypothetical protein